MYDPTKPFNEEIRALIRSTHPGEGPLTVKPFGKRFMLERDADYWKGFNELTSTDGIGTKGLLHWEMGTLANGVQDAFAMVVDDLIEGGYVPVTLQDHIMMQEEDRARVLEMTRALVKLSTENPWRVPEGSRPIIISGGETAIIDTLQGFEMSITATGYVIKGQEILQRADEGDAIIGLASSGVHSNGISFLREELIRRHGMRLSDVLPWGPTIGEELTKPTKVYLPAIKALIEGLAREEEKPSDAIHGMVHITGGGLSKLKELIPKGTANIEISDEHSLIPQEIFKYVQRKCGVPSEKMYTRFNNGVGYAVAVQGDSAEGALKILRSHFDADLIGRVTEGAGKVSIRSQYEPVTVTF